MIVDQLPMLERAANFLQRARNCVALAHHEGHTHENTEAWHDLTSVLHLLDTVVLPDLKRLAKEHPEDMT
jgi:hypothetical protein